MSDTNCTCCINGEEASYLYDQEIDDWFDEYEDDEEYKEHMQRERLDITRRRRLASQRGKYIIKAHTNGHDIYLQDQKISKHGYWTQYKANARVFDTQDAATNVIQHIKYNNPQIIQA